MSYGAGGPGNRTDLLSRVPRPGSRLGGDFPPLDEMGSHHFSLDRTSSKRLT